MCGIAGFFGHRLVSPERISSIRRAIEKRGPDAFHLYSRRDECDAFVESGEEVAATSALCHARLSIRDTRPEADQPMVSPDGRVWIVYNGEIYDWESHREDLIKSGFFFRTRSDTEFILIAYLQWGIDELLKKMRGMFSLVIVDTRIKKVFAVRDRMGLKPLVYYHNGPKKEFAFSSLIRGVVPYLAEEDRSFDPEGIDAFLAHRTIPAPRTVFSKIKRLENSHYLIYDIDTGRLDKKKYWDLSEQHSELSLDEEFDKAIDIRMVADRSVGLLLSSGIDSAVIACRLSDLNYDVKTFTATFADEAFDEGALAKEISERVAFSNHQLPILNDWESIFEQVVSDADDLFADPSMFPTWLLAREVSKSVKVVLTGDGGDELFAGYKRYRKHLRYSWRSKVKPLAFLRPAPMIMQGKWARLRQELSSDWLSSYALRFSGLGIGERLALQDLDCLPMHYWRISEDIDKLPPIKQLLKIDYENYLPEYVLRKADLMTMAHGLEARAPLLDHFFVSHVERLSGSERFTLPAKGILFNRCKLTKQLNLNKRKKKGFSPPVRSINASLRDRIDSLPSTLSSLCGGQISEAMTRRALSLWGKSSRYQENILQLLVLENSLGQLERWAK